MVALVPLARRELRKGLSTPKVPKVPTFFNAIIAKHECDPIIDVWFNGSVLHGMLVDGRARLNVMIILAMKYLKFKNYRLTSITLKMVNKQIIRLERVISNVPIIIMKVSTIVDFHVVLEEDGAYLMILGWLWLTNHMQGIVGAKDTWPLEFILINRKFHLQTLWRASEEWMNMMMNKK